MVTALLKASFLVVLSLLVFSTTTQAQSKAAVPQSVEIAQPQTYEQAVEHLAILNKALENLPTQGAHFTPEQYAQVEQWIQQNLKATEQQVAALKPKSVND